MNLILLASCSVEDEILIFGVVMSVSDDSLGPAFAVIRYFSRHFNLFCGTKLPL